MTDTITPRIDFLTELAGLFRLDGQVVLLPGGYGGIGEAIAWGAAMAARRNPLALHSPASIAACGCP
jgi:gluconate 5-dehydrogenase